MISTKVLSQRSFLKLLSLSIRSKVIEAVGSCMCDYLLELSLLSIGVLGVPIGVNPALGVLGADPLTVREVEATDVGPSGSLIEFFKGTATTLLLMVTLLALFSSLDALHIGSSNMGVL